VLTDCQYITTSTHYKTAASSISAFAAGAITPAAEGTKTVLMPLGPTSGEDRARRRRTHHG
jgi:hypothetical protein